MLKNSTNEILHRKGLKITPQRIAVLEAVIKLKNHPTAEKIINVVKRKYPNISVGTVYNVLETLVKEGIIKKVETDRDIMRYDAVREQHHHLYCTETNRIEDYFDDNLNKILNNYFKSKKIRDFKIEEIKLEIRGKFKK
ncbi:MAG: transcriptional repressor [Ignavibacteria bacterium]|nr:transcriptional repressor [Ignavibacteria bacterium]